MARQLKVEREGGNALVYSIPVVMDVIKYRAQLPDQIIADMSVYTIPALEDNAKVEAGRWMELAAKSQGGAALSPEDTAAMTAADFKLKQMLLEYILRGQDLPEFALRNGLLPAIHHRGLPERPPELAQPAAAPAAGPKAKGRQGAKSRR